MLPTESLDKLKFDATWCIIMQDFVWCMMGYLYIAALLVWDQGQAGDPSQPAVIQQCFLRLNP